MDCFAHRDRAAVGVCSVCRKEICRDCVQRESPRLVCSDCGEGGAILGFEYRSEAQIGAYPLVHVCTGVDAVTMRPKVARGVIAIGNVAVGGVAVGGVALGLVSVGGLAVGLLFALGGGALGLGLSVGGLAVGSIAFGGLAVGFSYALGGLAAGPAGIDATHCDPAARTLWERWLGASSLPPSCR